MKKFFDEGFKVRFMIFFAIIIINLIVQIFTPQLETLKFTSWVFFLANITFFMLGEPNSKKKFGMVLGGSTFGLCASWFFVFLHVILTNAGLSRVLCVMIPLLPILFLMIVFGPACPYLFNNVAFAYFTIALINAESAYVNVIPNVIWAALGNMITNGTVLLMIRLFSAKPEK